MNPKIKEDILRVLSRTIEILQVEHYFELSKISNHTIHNASIYQDENSISIAILVYSLSKILQRQNKKNRMLPKLIQLLKDADSQLVKNQEGKFALAISKTFRLLSKMDGRLKLYIQEVIEEAKIKKGYKLYQHGISIGRTAEILGINQWELMNYIGKTKIIDEGLKPSKVKQRLKLARSIFS